MRTSCVFAFLAVLLLAASPAIAEKRIALTFDDVPRARGAFFTPDQRTERLIAALKLARVRQAAFFVTPGNLTKADGVGGEQRINARRAPLVADPIFARRVLKETQPDAR